MLKTNPTLKTQGTWDFKGEHEARQAAALAIKQATEAKAAKERQAVKASTAANPAPALSPSIPAGSSI